MSIATGCSFNFLLLARPALPCCSVLYNISDRFYYFSEITQEKLFTGITRKRQSIRRECYIKASRLIDARMKRKSLRSQSNGEHCRMWQNLTELQLFRSMAPVGAGKWSVWVWKIVTIEGNLNMRRKWCFVSSACWLIQFELPSPMFVSILPNLPFCSPVC